MRLRQRILFYRLRSAVVPTLLRVLGLTLAVALAAVVPTFMTASMDGALQKQLHTSPDPLSVVVTWTAPDSEAYDSQLAAAERYLANQVPRAAGVDTAPMARLMTSGQRPVQQVQPDGQLQAGRRYFKLGALPEGLRLSTGRLPEPGAAEVVLLQSAFQKAGYQLGSRLRVPLTQDARGPTVDVTIVGTVQLATEQPYSHLGSGLESALLTSAEYWESLSVEVGEAMWAVTLPAGQFKPSGVAGLVPELYRLPLRIDQLLSGADAASTPVLWLADFLRQMAETERFLLVLLTPVFLLVVFFISAVAGAIAENRRAEIAVLRSRGATPLQVIAFYLPESLLLAATSLAVGLLLTLPAVKVMGLAAGFLQLVGRPPMAVTLSWQSLAYGLIAAILAEGAALLPLARATSLTVANLRQEASRRSVVATVARVMLELMLFAVVAYGTWRLRVEGGSPAADPLSLALPYLALVAVGLIALRLFAIVVVWLDKLASRWLTPALYLGLSLLLSDSARRQGLALMLVITAGLGIYGAAFARTLDRDLVAQVQYDLGADLVLSPAWETEVLSLDANGFPDEVVYREPPFDEVKNLPGVKALAQVQTRKGVSLFAGNRNQGKVDMLGIAPQDFGQVARFWTELTPYPPADYLNLLAQDERLLLISQSLADRVGLKPGDQLKANDVAFTVAAVVAYWPGRLPEEGDFLVGNLAYLQDMLGLAPYTVWVRLEPGASVGPLYEELRDRGVRLTGLADSRMEIAHGRAEPFRLGIYATLSAGFLLAVFVMGLTYLLNVGFTLQSRAKELGVLRAMGMSTRQVAAALYTEQLILVGTAAAIGLVAGAAVAGQYVPFLRRQAQPLLPLRVADVAGDRLYLVIALLLVLGVGVTAVALWLKRLKIHTVLRLGEDG